LAVYSVPFAWATQIVCISPASCANDQTLSIGSWGGSATADVELQGYPSSSATFNYYACPTSVSVSACTGQSGTDLGTGWAWSFSTASGTTGSCPQTQCEGAGFGSPSSLSLTVTSPAVPNSHTSESFTIYACTGGTSAVNCAGVYTAYAALTIVASVPQFGLGIGLAMAAGLLGLVLVKKRNVQGASVPASL